MEEPRQLRDIVEELDGEACDPWQIIEAIGGSLPDRSGGTDVWGLAQLTECVARTHERIREGALPPRQLAWPDWYHGLSPQEVQRAHASKSIISASTVLFYAGERLLRRSLESGVEDAVPPVHKGTYWDLANQLASTPISHTERAAITMRFARLLWKSAGADQFHLAVRAAAHATAATARVFLLKIAMDSIVPLIEDREWAVVDRLVGAYMDTLDAMVEAATSDYASELLQRIADLAAEQDSRLCALRSCALVDVECATAVALCNSLRALAGPNSAEQRARLVREARTVFERAVTPPNGYPDRIDGVSTFVAPTTPDRWPGSIEESFSVLRDLQLREIGRTGTVESDSTYYTEFRLSGDEADLLCVHKLGSFAHTPFRWGEAFRRNLMLGILLLGPNGIPGVGHGPYDHARRAIRHIEERIAEGSNSNSRAGLYIGVVGAVTAAAVDGYLQQHFSDLSAMARETSVAMAGYLLSRALDGLVGRPTGSDDHEEPFP